ncbi:MAG: AAA family ATPase [Bacteroidia bacterium]|nr:AAA family ATPase [Bacteroidia bacterium]
MIPLKLTIQGLYSYRSKQTIDFSKLTQAGLFGIFGNVGSGKSAILEAISFALFKESERLNARENRNYNMMNLKSNELLIDFEFKSNDDKEYRFTVKGKRNSKKFEDVKTFTWSAYEKNNSQWSPIDENKIESIIGLNYRPRRTKAPARPFQRQAPCDRACRKSWHQKRQLLILLRENFRASVKLTRKKLLSLKISLPA